MNSDEIIKIIAALGVGSGGSAVLTAILAQRGTKGKYRAEAADLLVGAAVKLNETQTDRISEQAEEIRALHAKMDTIQCAMLQYLAEEISRDDLLEIVRNTR